MKVILKNPNDTRKLAKRLAVSIKPNTKGAKLIGLSGNLGAGKTFFTKAFLKSLGVKSSVVSPTFLIMRSHQPNSKATNSFKKAVHFDFYRLESKKDLRVLRWKEVIKDKTSLIIVEWPENVFGKNLKDFTVIKFQHKGGNQRIADVPKNLLAKSNIK